VTSVERKLKSLDINRLIRAVNLGEYWATRSWLLFAR